MNQYEIQYENPHSKKQTKKFLEEKIKPIIVLEKDILKLKKYNDCVKRIILNLDINDIFGTYTGEYIIRIK